ncbi:coiled-coil domain-containing protein 102B isoform X3 [Odocoileus virginianus]|uniref:Coiled-coil domain-containing protein 102B isoform X3 n=1 Tax=Odocoileus virginianus TaxID=9874 RepID=A0ABM4H0E4_ODOVR
MNLDSIHRLIEETHIFGMQQSGARSPCDLAAPAPSPGGPGSSCPSPLRPQSLAAHSGRVPAWSTSEWDLGAELRLRELEEVKARAAQMEKTMRWWSDCTANWREKWSKVRAERNSAREEGRQLRIKLDMAVKELSALKKKRPLPHPAEAAQDRKLPGFPEAARSQRDPLQIGSETRESIRECLGKREFPTKENANSKEGSLIIDPLKLSEEMKLSLDCPDLFKNGGSENCAVRPGLRLQAINLPLENEVPEISALQGHLDDFQKVLWKEREMRLSLEKEIERLESALSVWKWKYEELKESNAKSLKQFDILHGQHKNEMEEVSGLRREESKSPNSNDRVVYELRAEELLDLQHAYCKLSRQYQAKTAELTHANNLVDQNEAKVKQLRLQVEELKWGLNQKEDKLDDFLNQIHKLQRSLNEQKETNENLEIKLRHLQNRILHRSTDAEAEAAVLWPPDANC